MAPPPLTFSTLTCEKVLRCLSSVHPLIGTDSFSFCKPLGLIAQPRQDAEGALEVTSNRHKLGTAAAAAARLNNEARAAAAFKATGTRLINYELCDAGVPSPATHFHQRTQIPILGWVLKLK